MAGAHGSTRHHRMAVAVGLAVVLAGRAVPAQTGDVFHETAPPPGFEELLAPQTNVVDLYYADRRVGSLVATFEPGTILFKDPAAVAAAIPNLGAADAVLDALTGPLRSNAERVCGAAPTPGCGRLVPAIAGVIFDEARFRVDLFVNRDFLTEIDLGMPRYLPPSPHGVALVTGFSGAASGEIGDAERDFNLRNRTLLGYRETRFRLDSSASSEDAFIIDEAFADRDLPGRFYGAGVFRGANIENLGQERLAGAAIGTSLDTRADLDVAFGSRLVVFLARRSQVDLIKDGRLISSTIYDAGNQTLDTSQLPDGAYDVTIRIREIGGQQRDEVRFFSKSEALPPADAPQYLLEAGFRVDPDDEGALPNVTATPLVHAGTRRRVSDRIALGADLLAGTNRAFTSLDGFLQGGDYQLRGSLLASTDLDVGAAIGLFGRWRRAGYSVSARAVRSGNEVAAGTVKTADFDPVTQSFTQARLSLTYQWGDALWSLQGLWRDSTSGETIYSVGPTVTYPIWRRGRMAVALFAAATQTQDATIVFGRLQFRFATDRLSAVADAGYRRDRVRDKNDVDDTGAVAALQASWRARDLVPGDLRLTAGLFKDAGRESARIGALHASRYGRYSATLEHDRRTDSRTLYSANGAFNWLGNGGGLMFVGRDVQDSAIVVSLAGTARDSAFDVIVDGRRRGEIRAGESLAVALLPYRTYDVRISPIDAVFVNYDRADREVTLYPGNVANLAWRADPITAVFGRALDEAGRPAAFARIEGAISDAFADDLGYFQAEISGAARLIFRSRRRPPCQIDLAAPVADVEFQSVGTLTCRPLGP